MALTLYAVVYLDSATDPANDATGKNQIKDGEDGDGNPAVWDGSATWTGSGQQLTASGLTDTTDYAAAAVVYDDVALTFSNRVLATFSTLAVFTFSPSGSVAFSGTVGLLRERLQPVSGAVAFSGAAALLRLRELVPAGEVVFSGTAPFATTAEFVITPTGTVDFSGSEDFVRLHAQIPAGSVAFSGSNDIERERSLVPTGSIVFSGSEDFNRVRVEAPVGQVVFAGHAAMIFIPEGTEVTSYINRLTVGVNRANRVS